MSLLAVAYPAGHGFLQPILSDTATRELLLPDVAFTCRF